jgi:NAD(P)-dependent dehydrogenase (short-subunit alcohol dehydrogenase family)
MHMKALAAGFGIGLALLAREAAARRSEEELRGRTALVTGGSRGLGFLLARTLAREGCQVAICARDSDELERARSSLGSEGGEIFVRRCDVSDQRQVEELVESVAEHFGPVDILVNNAGVIQVGPMQTMTVADFEKAMGVMFWGTVYPTLAVLPSMRERQTGHIVNITSIGGKIGAPRLLPYTSAKFAALGFSEGLHAELASEGIAVTTIMPGFMRTGSHVNAEFHGEEQYGWFALGASLPLISMDARRAAEQIVQAVKRKEAERILSLPANIAVRLHGVFPGVSARLAGVVKRWVLPGADRNVAARERGAEIERGFGSGLFEVATAWGRAAAHRTNQYKAGD